MNICHFGDCRDSMRRLIDDGKRVQMCVTSPPYYGLRDYGTGRWEGGDPACDHKGAPLASNKNTLGGGAGQVGPGFKVQEFSMPFLGKCGKCGATRIDGQLGLEETPEQYVANMVEVFRLVRDLLADDGTLWLNLGDSYSGAANSCATGKQDTIYRGAGLPSKGGKPKDLIGIPWRVAFALQSDGWTLRQDIIWHKPNPMPESVRDRCTKSHEYLFLLSKAPRYYFDAEAIQEPSDPSNNRRSAGVRPTPPGQQPHGGPRSGERDYKTRNRRSVWTIPVSQFSGTHFAVFPPALVKPCILAGSRVGDTVLDPFFGSGTTGQVAQELGRRWIGCELNEDYRLLQEQRTAQEALPL